MRTITVVILAIWLHGLLAQQAAPPRANNPSMTTSWVQGLDIDQLDPKREENLRKITLMLRSEDIPRTRRVEYARRYIRGEYKFHDANPNLKFEDNYRYVLDEAIAALGRLNDLESVPLLEEKLKQWEEETRKPLDERKLLIPNLTAARVTLARLKAVSEIPEVKEADALIRRLERMLRYIGFEGTIDKWLHELEKELEFTTAAIDFGPGINQRILWQYQRMLLEAGWNGINVEPAAKVIRLNPDSLSCKIAREEFEITVKLSKMPRDKAAQWIIDNAVDWQVYSFKEKLQAQILADMGISVLPLVWSKLEWATRHRDQIKGSGMGLVALMEVLVTIGGEQALPLIEPFVNDEDKWVRYYACRAKEYIQQGKVFRFAPYF
ncbi:MAG: hypothetical protein QXI60_08035 [Thermofilaceae archaeon]